jgi:hypothetical protein
MGKFVVLVQFIYEKSEIKCFYVLSRIITLLVILTAFIL